jgi:hypothetical protein
MGGAVPPLPNTPSWRGAPLGGAQGQLYLYLLWENFTTIVIKHENRFASTEAGFESVVTRLGLLVQTFSLVFRSSSK